MQEYAKILNPSVFLTKKMWFFSMGTTSRESVLKLLFAAEPILQHSDASLPIEIHTDADDVCLDIVLIQRSDEIE